MPTTKVDRLKQSRVLAKLTFSEEEYLPAEKQALEHLSSQVNLKGFRPGKAPSEMVKGKIDPEQLFEEAVRVLLANALPSLFEEQNIKPIMPPKVEAVSRLPLTLNLTFVEYPEVKIKGIDKLKAEKKEIKVDPKDMQRVIDSVLGEHRTFTHVEREAQKGDQLTIDFHATEEGGKEIEGLKAESYAVLLGEAQLLPGFEDHLTGLKADQEKSFTLTMPEKYGAEHLRNKPVTFHVKATKVEETKLPELTDAFAKEKLNMDSAAAFKEAVEKSIRSQEEQFQRMSAERELLERIKKSTDIDLAPELLDEETRALIHDFAHRLEEQGTSMQQWIEQQKKDPKKLEEEFREQAKDRATLRFGISKLIEELKIEPTEQEIQDAIAAFLESVPEENRMNATKGLVPGTEAYQEIQWRATVEKLMKQLLD